MIVKAKLKKMFKNIFFSRFALAHLQNRNAAYGCFALAQNKSCGRCWLFIFTFGPVASGF